MRGLLTSASGMLTQQTKIEVSSNNLANANTSGFKKSRTNFQDLMYQTLVVAGAVTPDGSQIPTGIQMGMGAKLASVQKDFSQGDYVHTGNELDLAIEGKGFFKVLSGGAEYYTRAGNFSLDSEGYLTSPSGDRLQPEIQVPSDAVTISTQSNGKVTVYGIGGQVLSEAQITLYTFTNPSGLYAIGKNLLSQSEGSGAPIEGTPGTNGIGSVSQGYLEMSNVSMVEEMVDLITGQRIYEACSKSLQTVDSMLQTAVNTKR